MHLHSTSHSPATLLTLGTMQMWSLCQQNTTAKGLGEQPLWGEKGEGRRSPTGRLTFSLLLGDHWRWLRKGLAYLTIGSRVGGCWRTQGKRQERETVTVTRRETGERQEEREMFQW